MKVNVTAVFDIGRTNKKFFLFDEDLKEVYREYVRFEEITDEDGYPTEDLAAIEKWAKEVFFRVLDSPEFDIRAVNFSCYGASLVHMDENGKVLAPLYNYMKPLGDEIYRSFYDKYGPEEELSRTTGSLKLGMLNTGMQLYWLKYSRPEIFKKIKYSLHLPQYLSYVFTGVPVSEYTSIGCHTLLWDYGKKDYHSWVYQEGIHEKLPPVASTLKTIPIFYKGKTVRIGMGVHDSSAALIPYVHSIPKPFVLVSTGTWSISINPFTKDMLTLGEIKKECLFNMRIDGRPVKVSRLFLGNEYKLQVEVLSDYFKVPRAYHKAVKFNKDIFFDIKKDFVRMFKWFGILDPDMPEETQIPYDDYDRAYHQLMLELVLLQEKSIRSAVGNDRIDRLYIDGGFSDNEVYIQLLSYYLGHMELSTTDSSLGSALGTAIVISDKTLGPKFLQTRYSLKKHMPFVAEQ